MSSFQTAQGHAFRKLFYAAGAVTASMSLVLGLVPALRYPSILGSSLPSPIPLQVFVAWRVLLVLKTLPLIVLLLLLSLFPHVGPFDLPPPCLMSPVSVARGLVGLSPFPPLGFWSQEFSLLPCFPLCSIFFSPWVSGVPPGGRCILNLATGNLPLTQTLLYIALYGSLPVAEA